MQQYMREQPEWESDMCKIAKIIQQYAPLRVSYLANPDVCDIVTLCGAPGGAVPWSLSNVSRDHSQLPFSIVCTKHIYLFVLRAMETVWINSFMDTVPFKLVFLVSTLQPTAMQFFPVCCREYRVFEARYWSRADIYSTITYLYWCTNMSTINWWLIVKLPSTSPLRFKNDLFADVIEFYVNSMGKMAPGNSLPLTSCACAASRH